MAFTKRNPAAVPTAGLERKLSSAEADGPRDITGQEFNQGFRHHADAPSRRPKSLAELIDGCELIELLDRKSPGSQVRGARR